MVCIIYYYRIQLVNILQGSIFEIVVKLEQFEIVELLLSQKNLIITKQTTVSKRNIIVQF